MAGGEVYRVPGMQVHFQLYILMCVNWESLLFLKISFHILKVMYCFPRPGL